MAPGNGEKIEPGRPVTLPSFIFIACFGCVCAFQLNLEHLLKAADQVLEDRVWPVPPVPLGGFGEVLDAKS